MQQDTHETERRKSGPATSPTGVLFIVSAPSGAGKTTLCDAVRDRFPDMAYSVSYTTRAPRSHEENARDYHFISKQEFLKGIETNRWAEWAQVHGNYYGTSAQWVEHALLQGMNILMDVDVQGMRQLKARFPGAVTIFILPPSMQELERRLRQRSTEDNEAVALRLKNAREEISQQSLYDHTVVNEDLNKATCDLVALIESYLNRQTSKNKRVGS